MAGPAYVAKTDVPPMSLHHGGTSLQCPSQQQNLRLSSLHFRELRKVTWSIGRFDRTKGTLESNFGENLSLIFTNSIFSHRISVRANSDFFGSRPNLWYLEMVRDSPKQSVGGQIVQWVLRVMYLSN